MNKENKITIKELAEHFRQEQPHLMRYACYRLGDADDAKDALQDVFLKISAKLSDEKCVEIRDWRNYIFRVLTNRMQTSRQKATKRTTNELPNYLWRFQKNKPKLYDFESMETTVLQM